jgi:hypothetical protein
MVKVSVLADNLKTMTNAEKRGRRQVMLRPSSKVVVKFLQQMMKHGPHSPPEPPHRARLRGPEIANGGTHRAAASRIPSCAQATLASSRSSTITGLVKSW